MIFSLKVTKPHGTIKIEKRGTKDRSLISQIPQSIQINFAHNSSKREIKILFIVPKKVSSSLQTQLLLCKDPVTVRKIKKTFYRYKHKSLKNC